MFRKLEQEATKIEAQVADQVLLERERDKAQIENAASQKKLFDQYNTIIGPVLSRFVRLMIKAGRLSQGWVREHDRWVVKQKCWSGFRGDSIRTQLEIRIEGDAISSRYEGALMYIPLSSLSPENFANLLEVTYQASKSIGMTSPDSGGGGI